MNPIQKFKEWYQEELEKSQARIPSACCLSTIGLDVYPNSRFVSLKEVIDDKFIITGPMNSRKGKELTENPKAALTFWWAGTERQVRIQGDIEFIEIKLADAYFSERNIDSQIVSNISQQGLEIRDLRDLEKTFAEKQADFKNRQVLRPENWGGFYLSPKRIELMEFKESRFHLREFYSKENDNWTLKLLQP